MLNEVNWADLIANGQAAQLAEAVQHRFDIEVDADYFLAHCRSRDWYVTRHWSPDCAVLWIKRQLDLLEAFPCGEHTDDRPPFPGVELHVGFVAIPEDEEMLERLRRNESPVTQGQVARSKISKAPGHIQPVNKVAFRVAPPEEFCPVNPVRFIRAKEKRRENTLHARRPRSSSRDETP